MKRQLSISLVLAILGCGLLLAASATHSARAGSRASAPATNYVVGNAADTSGLSCSTPANCTLRSAVEKANLSVGSDNISISSTVTSIVLGRPITLTGGSIYIYGNGKEVTALLVNGNFSGLVLSSDDNVITHLWIKANGSRSGSAQHGILINNSVSNHISDNSLSNLGGDGVDIEGGGYHQVYANVIGTVTVGGTQWAACDFPNNQWGVRINNSANNLIYNNTIGCSGQDGVGISGASAGSNELYGNYIGVVNRGFRLANTLAGVAVFNGAHNNLIGEPLETRNVIGGNKTFGVYIGGSGTGFNFVQLNSIGVSGTTNLSNTIDGVHVDNGTQSNLIYSNTIADNADAGVYLGGAGTQNNRLRGNLIRLNGTFGVLINNGAAGNSVGEAGAHTIANVISANKWDGVYISDASTSGNTVINNYIGTNKVGNAADGNAHHGVTLDFGTHGNFIGNGPTTRNVIGSNGWDGIAIANGAHDNYIQYNDIGLNRDFPVIAAETSNAPTGGGIGSYINLANGGDGIGLFGSFTNTISYYNYIFYNHASGIYLTNQVSNTQHNLIGSNTVVGNKFYGILLNGGNTAYNVISRTVIFRNGYDGIGERGSAGFNIWSEVQIGDNGGLGIDKDAANDALNLINPPTLFFDSINKNTGVVNGHADASILGTVKIELYHVAPDGSGFGEGNEFVGSDITDVSGNWTITDLSPLSARGCYTAFVTESFLVIPFSSSEFSVNTCRTFLPMVLKNH
jgi:parallel beta-helix repeat protein